MMDEPTHGLPVRTGDLDLSELVQLQALKGTPSLVELHSGSSESGWIGFGDGRVVYARTETSLGALSGNDAFFQIFSWDTPQLMRMSSEQPPVRNIETTLTQLMLEAYWRAEELRMERLMVATQEVPQEQFQSLLEKELSEDDVPPLLPRLRLPTPPSRAAEPTTRSESAEPEKEEKLRALRERLEALAIKKTNVPELLQTVEPNTDEETAPGWAGDVLPAGEPSNAALENALEGAAMPVVPAGFVDPLLHEASEVLEEALGESVVSDALDWSGMLDSSEAPWPVLCSGVLRLPGCVAAGLLDSRKVVWLGIGGEADLEDARGALEMTEEVLRKFRAIRAQTPVERLLVTTAEQLYMWEQIEGDEALVLAIDQSRTTLAAIWWALGQLITEARERGRARG